MRAYRALVGYAPERREALRIRGWLASITLNLARNRARSRRPEAADLDSVGEPPDDRDRGPERLAERRESAQRWRRLLAALPRNQGLAVELRHVEGLSYAEIAGALGKPLGSVKSDVHRGVRRLRRAFEEEEGGRVAEVVAPQVSLPRISPPRGPSSPHERTGIDRRVAAR